MPLEIRELVIKATLGGKQSNASSNNNNSNESAINEIVDKVLEIIKEKNER